MIEGIQNFKVVYLRPWRPLNELRRRKELQDKDAAGFSKAQKSFSSGKKPSLDSLTSLRPQFFSVTISRFELVAR